MLAKNHGVGLTGIHLHFYRGFTIYFSFYYFDSPCCEFCRGGLNAGLTLRLAIRGHLRATNGAAFHGLFHSCTCTLLRLHLRNLLFNYGLHAGDIAHSQRSGIDAARLKACF